MSPYTFQSIKHPPARIRICVRDATRMGTQLLTDVLRRDRRFEVVDVDSCNRERLATADIQVAVLFCDPDGATEQLTLVRRLRTSRPDLKVVALMDDPKPAALLQAFRAGVRGIFSRSDSYKALPKCVVKVHNGQVWASQAQISVLVEAIGQPFPLSLVDAKGTTLLSRREEHVVHWVAEGLTNREIADRMELSEHTVKNYLFRVFDKLGVSSRAELVLYAVSRLSSRNEEMPRVNIPEPPRTDKSKCDYETCPWVQFNLGREHSSTSATVGSYEQAYLAFSVAEGISSVIRKRSLAALAHLERLLSSDRLLKLKSQTADHLRNVLTTKMREDPEAIDRAGDRVA